MAKLSLVQGKLWNERARSEPGLGAFMVLCGMSEITFEVLEDEVAGGFTASALGVGMHTEGETLDELRANVREAVDCYFDETMEALRIIYVDETSGRISAPLTCHIAAKPKILRRCTSRSRFRC